MDEYDFVEAAPPQPMQQDGPPLPGAEANGAEAGDKKGDEDRKRSSRDRSGDRRRSGSKDRKRRWRSKSRERRRSSRDQDRGDRPRRGDRERSRDRLVRRRSDRSRSKERRRSDHRDHGRERSPEPVRERPPRREMTPPEVRAERERQAEMEALDRDTRTVFAYNLSLKAAEKDIFQFFIKAGPLNDIKIIADKTTGRSKGFAYVEFQRKEDVINALALTGQLLNGQPVMVKMSEAEKNLAWEAAEQAKRQQKEYEALMGPAALVPLLPPMPAAPGMGGFVAPAAPVVTAGPARLSLANLPTSITENDLRPIFEPFGNLDFVTLQRDTSARPTGNGFVQYQLLSDATKAKENLHGLDLVGHKLGVTWASMDAPLEAMAIAPPPPPLPMPPPQMQMPPLAEPLDETADGTGGGGLKLTGQSRAALMSKLAANAGLDTSNVPQLPVPQAPVQPQVPTALSLEQGLLGPASPIPTQCLLLKNMFDPAEEEGPNWDQEIAEDVGGECSKYGPVEHVYVDQHSRGFVYVKFSAVASAANAQRALHGRWFAQRQIAVDFQFTPIYNQHFGV